MENLSLVGISSFINTKAQIQQIIDLYAAYYHQDFPIQLDVFHSTIMSLPDTQWLLVLYDTQSNRVCGIVNVLVEHSLLYGGKSVCHITELIVVEPLRRKGYGTYILDNILHYARRQKCKLIRACITRANDASTAFFVHNGFNCVNTNIYERGV